MGLLRLILWWASFRFTGIVRHFREYVYLLSCRELGENINTSLVTPSSLFNMFYLFCSQKLKRKNDTSWFCEDYVLDNFLGGHVRDAGRQFHLERARLADAKLS